MNSKSERRDFYRFPTELLMEVAAEDMEGGKYKEKVVLRDVSGEGAKFVTQQADKYFPDQLLEIIIYLPGTDDVKAHMRGRAKVRRIDLQSGSGIGEKSEETGIAVKIDTRLYFERDDVKTPANHGEPIRDH